MVIYDKPKIRVCLLLSGGEESDLWLRLQMHNVSAVSFHYWTRKNTLCCHYTIPQKLWPFFISAPFSLNLRRNDLNDHLFALQDSNLRLPLHASVLPLHQTDFTKYRPYSLLTLHGFLFRYFPTPPNHIVQMLSEITWAEQRNRTFISGLDFRCANLRVPRFPLHQFRINLSG